MAAALGSLVLHNQALIAARIAARAEGATVTLYAPAGIPLQVHATASAPMTLTQRSAAPLPGSYGMI